MRQLSRAVQLLLIVAAVLAVPSTALAGKIEPGGATPPVSLKGTDRYGAVDGTLTNVEGTPGLLSLSYANACSKTPVEISGDIPVGANGLFALTRGRYAVSGIVIVNGESDTVRASVESTRVCHGQTGPVTFTAVTIG